MTASSSASVFDWVRYAKSCFQRGDSRSMRKYFSATEAAGAAIALTRRSWAANRRPQNDARLMA